MVAVKVENINKSFKKTQALIDVSFEIKEGELVALLGENGAGKTTLIKILCSLLKKDGGKAEIFGLDLDKDSKNIKPLVNISLQETAVAPNLTVLENLKLICSLYGADDGNIEKIINRLGLSKVADKKAKTLSGGTQRRLSIALSLITEPKLLFLDEPTLALDVSIRRELWKLIKELKKEMTVVLTTHYIEEAKALADRAIILSEGKVVAVGTPEQLTANAGKSDFEEAFLYYIGEGAE